MMNETANSFSSSLDKPGSIVLFCIDRPDPDNFISVQVYLLRHPDTVVHIVLVGRQFSPILTQMVFNPETTMFDLEIWENDKPRIVSVLPKDLGPFVKQQAWEENYWSILDMELLLGIYAADLRSYLSTSGIDSSRYTIFHGEFAELAGISCHIHAYDHIFNKSSDYSSYVPCSGEDHASACKTYRKLSTSERITHFRKIATRIQPAMRQLKPLSDFDEIFAKNPLAPILVFVCSPCGSVVKIFKDRPEAAARVTYMSAMFGAWDGSKNILGMNFNNAVDLTATIDLIELYNKGHFPNSRFVISPTEACKNGPFTLTASSIRSLPAREEKVAARDLMAANVSQWTSLKRVEQPLFDVTLLITPADMITHASLVPVTVQFGQGPITLTVGSRENMSMSIGMTAEPLNLNSPFPPGMYSMGADVFQPTCAEAFLKLFKEGFQ